MKKEFADYQRAYSDGFEDGEDDCQMAVKDIIEKIIKRDYPSGKTEPPSVRLFRTELLEELGLGDEK